MRTALLIFLALGAAAIVDGEPPPPVTCGDRTVGGVEECDDGNTTSGDGCSATCELENTSALCAGIPTVGGTGLHGVVFARGLARPLGVVAPRLDPSRVFIVEQAGTIRVVKNGVLLPTPFLDIHAKTSAPCPYSERGLLGLAFDPDYETNGRFYVNYTDTEGTTKIARYVAAGDPKTSDVADAATETILRSIAQPFANHNGGELQFGPDRLLYIGLGDGGSACDPGGRAQDDGQRLGKMLRIDPNVPEPANPLDDVLWKGLRNPWRYSFDRATGDLYIADVGQKKWEEVDVVPAPLARGLNFGWNHFEGLVCASTTDCPKATCPQSEKGFTMPVLVYDHDEGCSITGGYVYRGCAMPDLRGTYFYSDFCTAFVRSFVYAGGVATKRMDRTRDVAPGGTDAITSVTSFGEDARGELYIAEQGDCATPTGTIYKLVPRP
jgi:cysteine-rich repeat protein